ncbi:MAG: 5'-nucleotidase C-terminal domain-containing protein [Clostridiales bacterium]|nr:5'-nucleotidase C-terminal domain-containing protein [Clostridiales bacterium]
MYKKISKLKVFFLMSTVILSLLSCGSYAAKEKEIVILHTNDVHSRAKDNGLEIGYARFSTYIKSVRNELKVDPIVLDAGDAFHGKIISYSSEGESIVNVMNRVGYTAMCPGNHDFNYGSKRLVELSQLAKFNVLSANVVDLEKKHVFTPYIIIEREGVKIGIFGLCTPETATKTNPKNVRDVEFQECIEVSKRVVNELKSKKVDAIICLGHIGLDTSSVITSDVICSSVDGIDLFVDGHSHTKLENGLRVNNTYIVSTGQYLNNIGQVKMRFGKGNKLVNIECELISKEEVSKLEEDPEIVDFINEIEREQSHELGEIIAHTDIKLDGERKRVRTSSTNMSKMLSQAIYEFTNADVAILNGGTIRSSIDIGDITRMDIISVLPFDNTLVTKKMTGSQLKKVLEEGVGYYPVENGGFPDIAGMTYKFDPNRPKGSRVISIKKDGEDIKMNKEYIVALSDYLDEGGDNYPFADIPFIDEHKPVNEIFTEYLRNNPVIGESNDIMVNTKIIFTPVDMLIWYRVSEGEGLESIAKKYGVDVYDIAKMNDLDLRNPKIWKGQILFIQKAS